MDHDKDDDELINVEFDFQDLHEDHFLSLKNLMKKSTWGRLMFPNLYGYNSQVPVGTMVTILGERDVCGFVTALSPNEHKGIGCISKVCELILQNCPSPLKDLLEHFLCESREPLLLVPG